MLEELSALAGKSGYQTTEFWRGVLLKLLAILAVLLHKDLNGSATWVPTAATILAGLDTAVYTLGRSKVKQAAAMSVPYAPETQTPPIPVGTDGSYAGDDLPGA